MQEPFTHLTAVDDIEPVIQRTDAIAELAERLSFVFAWMLDARDSKAVALRAYVATHFFCPSYIGHETLTDTGKRLGVTRQAVSKLTIELKVQTQKTCSPECSAKRQRKRDAVAYRKGRGKA